MQYDISDNDIGKIINFKSNIANNAEFTFNFIDEIARIEDMKKMEKTSIQFPIGNWVHSFKTFSDIVDILRTEFGFSKPIEDLAIIENLKYEILENVKLFFLKEKDKIYQLNNLARSVAKNFNDNLVGESTFSKNDFESFKLFIAIGIGFAHRLSTFFIDSAIKSGKFLRHNKADGGMDQGPISTALLKLKQYIEEIKSLELIPYVSTENRIALVEKI